MFHAHVVYIVPTTSTATILLSTTIVTLPFYKTPIDTTMSG